MTATMSSESRDVVICGMWGTTNLSLFLVELDTGAVLGQRSGKGISKLARDGFADELFKASGDWLTKYAVKNAVLAGMVGSTIGWRTAPYMDCPAVLWNLSDSCVSEQYAGVSISIAPGLSCMNGLNQPDVMRGEEVELLGWLAGDGRASDRPCLVCIPGTHTKWAEIIDGAVERFHTAVVGEVFDVLTRNGVLAAAANSGAIQSKSAFIEGVRDAAARPDALLTLLMSVRARTVLDGEGAAEASDRLSGLLIGADIATALNLTSYDKSNRSLPVIGAVDLAERYVVALEVFGVAAVRLDRSEILVKGLSEIAISLRSR